MHSMYRTDELLSLFIVDPRHQYIVDIKATAPLAKGDITYHDNTHTGYRLYLAAGEPFYSLYGDDPQFNYAILYKPYAIFSHRPLNVREYVSLRVDRKGTEGLARYIGRTNCQIVKIVEEISQFLQPARFRAAAERNVEEGGWRVAKLPGSEFQRLIRLRDTKVSAE